jgi:phage tail sheath protein FI
MASYLTPGVYVEEVALLPPSVAEVATAIPAFIGYASKFVATARELKRAVLCETLKACSEQRLKHPTKSSWIATEIPNSIWTL